MVEASKITNIKLSETDDMGKFKTLMNVQDTLIQYAEGDLSKQEALKDIRDKIEIS